MTSFYRCKFILFSGLAVWLSIAAINNATDPGTNIHLLTSMMSMEGLIENSILGNGLEWRSIDSPMLAKVLLTIIVIAQFSISLLLWRAAWMQREFIQGKVSIYVAIDAGNYASMAFMALWLFFLSGGLFFGYWMKFGGPQGVHFTLLIISILTMIINNLPALERSKI